MFESQRGLAWSKLKVGLLVSVALIIVFFAVFFSGVIERILSPKAPLYVYIPDVKGLRKGAPVWLMGIEVGRVRNMYLDPKHGVLLILEISRNDFPFIHSNAEAVVSTLGLLGDKYVEISPGTPGAPPVLPGGTIKGRAQLEFSDIIETSVLSIQKTQDFLQRLDELISRFETSKGTIPKLINDPTLYNQLSEASRRLSEAVQEFRQSQGTVNMLLKDPSLYNRMLAATSSVEELSRKIQTGNGTLQKLMENPQVYENLNRASAQLSSILDRINRGEGTAGTLVRDRQLAMELRDTIAEAKSVLEDIKKNPKRYFKFSLF